MTDIRGPNYSVSKDLLNLKSSEKIISNPKIGSD